MLNAVGKKLTGQNKNLIGKKETLQANYSSLSPNNSTRTCNQNCYYKARHGKKTVQTFVTKTNENFYDHI